MRRSRASNDWQGVIPHPPPNPSPTRGEGTGWGGADVRKFRGLYATRREAPQLLSEAQIERSSRKRSIGAELLSARMR